MSSKLLSSFCVLTLGLSAVACGDDAVINPPRKGQIDRPALEGGVTVTISGDVGTVVLPFVEAVPEIGDDTSGSGEDTLEDEMASAVSLVVTSSNSGATADLASGTVVGGAPIAPGEWNWELNGARDQATMTFYNTSPGGLTLKSAVSYDASLSIATNEYIEEEEAFAFTVSVE